MLGMKKTKTMTRLFIVITFLSLVSKSNSQYRTPPTFSIPAYPAPRPLCLSQFLLVNHACSKLPHANVSPPSPILPPPVSPSPPSSGAPASAPLPSNGHRHRRHYRHRHRRGGSYQETSAEIECCRWLKEVDTKCVCDLLVYLPTFLAKPRHNYSVSVAEDCTVVYECPSRVIF